MARPDFVTLTRAFAPSEALITADTEEAWESQLFAPPVEDQTVTITVEVPNSEGQLEPVEQTSTAEARVTTPDNLPDLSSEFTAINDATSVFKSGLAYGDTEIGESTPAVLRLSPLESTPGVARPGRSVTVTSNSRAAILAAYLTEGWAIYYANPNYTPEQPYTISQDQTLNDVPLQVEFFRWTGDNNSATTYFLNPNVLNPERAPGTNENGDILDTDPGLITQTV